MFGKDTKGVMAKLNVEGQHRGAVAAAKAAAKALLSEQVKVSHHGHDHEGHVQHKEVHSHAEDGHEHSDCKVRAGWGM